MNRLFWGLFFVTLHFNVTLGTATIGLLPDFLGWYLLMKGMEELAEESEQFNKGRHWAFGLMLLNVILYVADLMNLSSGTAVGLWSLGLAGFCVGCYVLYRMVLGIREMETNHRWDLQGEKLKTMWLIQTVMGAICYLLNWIPLISAFAALAAAVTAICMLAAMYGTKKRHRQLREEMAEEGDALV